MLGVLSGQTLNRDYGEACALTVKLSSHIRGNRFDRYMAHPALSPTHIVGLTLLLVAFRAMDELAAFGGAKCISLIVATIREY